MKTSYIYPLYSEGEEQKEPQRKYTDTTSSLTYKDLEAIRGGLLSKISEREHSSNLSKKMKHDTSTDASNA